MTKTQAIKELRKLLGPRFAFKENPNAPTGAKRIALQEAWDAARRDRAVFVTALRRREAELKQMDAEYQRLILLARGARLAQRDAEACNQRRIMAGTNTGWLFAVEAEADTWDAIVAIVKFKQEQTK